MEGFKLLLMWTAWLIELEREEQAKKEAEDKVKANAAGLITCPVCNKGKYTTESQRCPTCHSFIREFERLCPSCKQALANPMANKCDKCGSEAVPTVDSMSFYVICTKCGTQSEWDDWMVRRRLPLIFPTRKGVKIAVFQTVEVAAKAKLKFFKVHGTRREPDVMQALQNSDEEAWEFASSDAARQFIRSFPCEKCSSIEWNLTPWVAFARTAAKASQPLFSAMRSGAGSWVKKGATSLGGALSKGWGDIRKDFSKLSKKGK